MKRSFVKQRQRHECGTGDRGELAYAVDPVHVGGDSGEDGGLLGVVAAVAGAEADDAVNLPSSFAVLAVQRAARIPLFKTTNS